MHLIKDIEPSLFFLCSLFLFSVLVSISILFRRGLNFFLVFSSCVLSLISCKSIFFLENFFSMESAKEEAHETPLSLEQEDQDAESEIEWMSSSELLLSVLSGSLKSEVVQHYDKLRKLELTLMDQVINLTLDEGEFHEEAIVSLQKRISMIQVTLKLLKQTLARETKFETSEPEYSDIRS